MAHSKYSDEKLTGADLDLLIQKELHRYYREHAIDLPDERAFTPGRGPGLLAIKSAGDWAWHPERSSERSPTYRPALHPRACRCCGLTSCLSLIADSSCA